MNSLRLLQCSRLLQSNYKVFPCVLSAKPSVNYEGKRGFALQQSVETVAKSQTGLFKTLSESTPVEFLQNVVLQIHDTTGLPWWATIITTTVILRSTVTLPLAAYQQYIMAKLTNLNMEMPDIVKELKKETAVAVRMYKWDEKTTKYHYKRSLKKQWNKLIERDNCHPFKASLLLLFQIPLWVSFSVCLRNLVYMLPHSDVNAQVTFMELSLGGFGWIPNLTEVDSSFILPVTLGLINLTIIEIQALSKVNVPTKFQTYMTHVFRGFSIIMVPLACCVPSSLSLYWTVSSGFGLFQNLLLMSPKVKRFFRIPHTFAELERPYYHVWEGLKHKVKGFSLQKNNAS